MVRTKNTAKKPEDEGRPPLALVSRFHCVDCGKGFGDMTHLRRHAGAVHNHDEVGGPVDPAQKAKYLIWNKRGKRDPAPTLEPPKLPKVSDDTINLINYQLILLISYKLLSSY